MLNRRNLLRMAPVALVPTVAVAAPIIAHAEPVKDMSVLADYFYKTWRLPPGMEGGVKSIKLENRDQDAKLSVLINIMLYDKSRFDLEMFSTGSLYTMQENLFHRMTVWFVAQRDADIIGIHPEARDRFVVAVEDSVNDGRFHYDNAIKLYTGLPNSPSERLHAPNFMHPSVFPEKPTWFAEA